MTRIRPSSSRSTCQIGSPGCHSSREAPSVIGSEVRTLCSGSMKVIQPWSLTHCNMHSGSAGNGTSGIPITWIWIRLGKLGLELSQTSGRN